MECFAFLVRGKKVYDSIETLSRNYGVHIATRFPTVLNTTKRQGHDYAGMLLCVLITIVSKGGQRILSRSLPNVFDTEFLNKQVHLIELILCMEGFLKHGQLRKGDLKHLPKLIVHFINCITSTCKRDGIGNRLIKIIFIFISTIT